MRVRFEVQRRVKYNHTEIEVTNQRGESGLPIYWTTVLLLAGYGPLATAVDSLTYHSLTHVVTVTSPLRVTQVLCITVNRFISCLFFK